jgi:proteasome accessory factor C
VAERRVPAMAARDKLAVLISLVPYLMDRDRVTVAEAARHFGLTEPQVREAVSLIGMSGVPGQTATYQHEDLFDIDWEAFEDDDEIVLMQRVAIEDSPRFSAREAAALIAGLQYLSSLPENADREALGTLMAKLSAGASAAPAAVAVGTDDPDETLAVVREAVRRGVQLEFDYSNAQGEHERRGCDPLRVESVDLDWYLRAWCHLRQGVRTFRIDRMSDVRLTGTPIEHRPGDVVIPEGLFAPTGDDLLVTVEVATTALPLIADYLPDGAAQQKVGDRIRTTLRVSHFHGLKRLVASMPGLVTVLDPAGAREAVADWAAAGAAQYDGVAPGTDS